MMLSFNSVLTKYGSDYKCRCVNYQLRSLRANSLREDARDLYPVRLVCGRVDLRGGGTQSAFQGVSKRMSLRRLSFCS